MEVQDLIDKLGLVPLLGEGGMYCPTYTSKETRDGRPMGTAIFYLLRGDAFSHLHRLDTDEIYHFYLGDPVELYQLDDSGNLTKTVLGQDISAGQQLQAVARGGVWHGSHLLKGGSWALMGTTMAPGYIDACYTHGNGQQLASLFPQHADIIKQLTTSNVVE